MVSYADMITILMSFFAVMFSMAMSKDAKKDVPMIKSLQRQFGALQSTFYLPYGAVLPPRAAADRVPLGKYVSMSPASEQATIGGVIFFDFESSGLNEEQRRQLQTLAKVFFGKTGKIEILAHTLGRPSDADDDLGRNWSLAHARCNSAKRYLAALGIDPGRLRIGVAARFEPILPRGGVFNSVENNDSVEVFTIDDATETARAESTDHARN